MAADALSDLLRTVRLTGAVFFNLDVSEPWVAEAPPATACRPFVMPAAQHVIEFHVVTKGSCWGGLLDQQPIRLQHPGDGARPRPGRQHDILGRVFGGLAVIGHRQLAAGLAHQLGAARDHGDLVLLQDRKSTRLNSSH